MEEIRNGEHETDLTEVKKKQLFSQKLLICKSNTMLDNFLHLYNNYWGMSVLVLIVRLLDNLILHRLRKSRWKTELGDACWSPFHLQRNYKYFHKTDRTTFQRIDSLLEQLGYLYLPSRCFSKLSVSLFVLTGHYVN